MTEGHYMSKGNIFVAYHSLLLDPASWSLLILSLIIKQSRMKYALMPVCSTELWTVMRFSSASFSLGLRGFRSSISVWENSRLALMSDTDFSKSSILALILFIMDSNRVYNIDSCTANRLLTVAIVTTSSSSSDVDKWTGLADFGDWLFRFSHFRQNDLQIFK